MKATVIYYHNEGDNVPAPEVGKTTQVRTVYHYHPDVPGGELHETSKVVAVGPNGQFETEKTIYLPRGKSSYDPSADDGTIGQAS